VYPHFWLNRIIIPIRSRSDFLRPTIPRLTRTEHQRGIESGEGTVNTEESFDSATYKDEVHVEDGELSAFLNAVKKTFGAEQAGLAAKDWLDESDIMDSPPRATGRDWRAITIAASARLENRLKHDPESAVLVASPDLTMSPGSSSDCAPAVFLV
jgi:hypothetical protein